MLLLKRESNRRTPYKNSALAILLPMGTSSKKMARPFVQETGTASLWRDAYSPARPDAVHKHWTFFPPPETPSVREDPRLSEDRGTRNPYAGAGPSTAARRCP